mgnify:CR=1 FL=1
MKSLEQLATEFVCEPGKEPTEKQTYEIAGLVEFGRAALLQCQPTPFAADSGGIRCSACGTPGETYPHHGCVALNPRRR